MGDFEAVARVASGSELSRAVTPYVVTVADERLTLRAHTWTGTVLQVPVDILVVRPLGRAGGVVVEVGESPVLLDFTVRPDRDDHGVGVLVRRTRRGLRGRAVRRRFVSAVGGEG